MQQSVTEADENTSIWEQCTRDRKQMLQQCSFLIIFIWLIHENCTFILQNTMKLLNLIKITCDRKVVKTNVHYLLTNYYTTLNHGLPAEPNYLIIEISILIFVAVNR